MGPDEDLVPCIECGALVSPGVDRTYAVGNEDVLCMSCAIRRGGSYDALKDHWQAPPDTSGLPIRDRPRHAQG